MSSIHLRRAAAAVLILLFTLGCSKPAQALDLKQIALQAADLPPGMSRCAQSGSVDDYLKAFAGNGSQWLKALNSAWSVLQTHGAKAGWVESYKDPKAGRPCQPLVNEDTSLAAASLIVRFKDDQSPAGAVAQGMYLIVGPSDSHTFARGATTGLGENSYLALRAIYGYFGWYAVWQRGDVAVLFVAENIIDLHAFAFSLESIDARMQGRKPTANPSLPPALQALAQSPAP